MAETTFLRRVIPEPDLGLTSLVLGTLGLALFFLPILGIPFSACGLAIGLVGCLSARRDALRLRWCIGSAAVCAVALAINAAIAYAPEGAQRIEAPRQLWRPVTDRPAVPPPAAP